MKKKDFAIIGLSYFGESIINALRRYNQNIAAFDIDPEAVKRISHLVDFSAVIDSSDKASLKAVSITDFDYVIVAIPTDSQDVILTTAILKELGVKNVIARASDERVMKILEILGASQVINPEKDSGERLAHRLLHSLNVEEVIPLDETISIVYLKVTTAVFAGKTLAELEIRKKYDINIVAIKRDNKVFIPQFSDSILSNDVLVIVGKEEDVKKFEVITLK
jgi:trk system potassium uptake protein TrkA